MRMSGSVADNLKLVLDKIQCIYAQSPPKTRAKSLPQLVAMSKTKPKEDIITCYRAGQRLFGENYIQELYEKSNDEEILKVCPELSWHFVGTVQNKNVSKLLRVRNLSTVETVSSEKVAEKLQNGCSSRSLSLNVMVQINSSGEDQKGGVLPAEASSLVGYVLNECPNMKFVGLMTIGSADSSVSEEGDNPDFLAMRSVRSRIAKEYDLEEEEITLSMGMSNDVENAVKLGSGEVRVGSKIFGPRNVKTN